MLVLKILIGSIVAVIASAVGLFAFWSAGYVSRVVAEATSPDGRIEAVCRGRLPESTEYDLWLRGRGDLFGWRLGWVGTESMGRCRGVAWSPGGEVVATLSEGGHLGVFDGRTAKPLGSQRLLEPDGNYPTRRIVTSLRFESPGIVTFEHCDRLWHTTRGRDDYFRCGPDVQHGRVVLNLAPPRGMFGR